MNLTKYLAYSQQGKSHAAALVLSTVGDSAQIPILRAAELIGMPAQTMRNQVSKKTFPIRSHMQGGRRMCLVADIITYLDSLNAPEPSRRGARTKAERIAAQQSAQAGGAQP